MQVRKLTALVLAMSLWCFAASCSNPGIENAQIPDQEPTPVEAQPAATPAPVSPTENLVKGCVDGFDPRVDYFPDKVSLGFASNFTVEYHGHYKILTVREPYPGGVPVRYILVQCGSPPPRLGRGFEDAVVLDVPISEIFTGSTTHLPMLVALDREDSIRGVAQTAYISSTEVLGMVAEGDVIEFAPTFSIDAEIVIEAAPDVLLSSGTGPSDAHEAIVNAGVDVVWNGEWLETTPLGRSEWLKMVALLFNEERRATEIFEGISSQYLSYVDRTKDIDVDRRPAVMTGVEFGGIFYASGGQSFAARLIEDAGGDYVWSEDGGTSAVETDMETQLERAGDSDVWINGGAFWMSLDDVAEADERYTLFAPYETEQIWANNLALNETGANDYFELGVLRPDLVLADLVSILHPTLAAEHQRVFYRRLRR